MPYRMYTCTLGEGIFGQFRKNCTGSNDIHVGDSCEMKPNSNTFLTAPARNEIQPGKGSPGYV